MECPATTYVTGELKQELSELYNAPGSFYHTRKHVDAMLALFALHRERLAYPACVEAAIWFHDAIYDSRRKDNETNSALLAVERLSGSVEAAALEYIRVLIEATTKHAVPDLPDSRAVDDARLFLDMDLSILGTDAAVFDAYEQAVRQEYAWVDAEAWRQGRSAVLKTFLGRPRVFFSDVFFAAYEVQARANLARSIARLEQPTAGRR